MADTAVRVSLLLWPLKLGVIAEQHHVNTTGWNLPIPIATMNLFLVMDLPFQTLPALKLVMSSP